MLLSVGMTFIVKADFGVSVVQAPAYVISLVFNPITFGLGNYIVQTILLIVLVIILRTFKMSYILAFLVGIFYSITLDASMWLFKNLEAVTLTQRILYFIIGYSLLPIAVSLFFRVKVAIMPYDTFIRELVEVKKLKLAKAKWIFDICCLIAALSISLIAFGNIQGVGIGTIALALTVSPIMSLIIKFFDKYIVFAPIFKIK